MPKPPRFVHLHTHSHYSLLDGLSKVPELVDRVKELGMDAIALTDHGVLYGAVEFYKKAKKEGIKPILGVEAYVAPRDRFSKESNERYYHLILLAENETGWKNLVKIVSKAHIEGFYYKPRVDKELLQEYHEGLIALSGCLGSEVDQALLANRFEDAKKTALEYREIFGADNYFLEIQSQDEIPECRKVWSEKIRLSKETGIPLVATRDSHYLKKEDAEYHEILLAVQTGNKLTDDDRLSLKAGEFYVASPQEMADKFGEVPEAIENTARIADRCNVGLELGNILLPEFPKPEGKSRDEYIKELVEKRLPERYPGDKLTPEVRERLDYELGVITKTGFADYFLIVQDLVNWAKDHGIAVGPGRGSAAGSIVSYILNITDLDPLKYGLLFERFLNPERIQMPDIDIDFADTRRDEVLAYAREKYGEDHVAQIITFGTMAARAAVRDAGRAMGLPYGLCDQIAKLIPLMTKLKDALKQSAELRQMYETNEDARKVLDAAIHLEGVARHASVHACGTVIAKNPLMEHVPLQYAPQDKQNIITQFEMHAIEDLGLLKIDLLGLKNLTIIQDAVRLVRDLTGEKIEMSKIPLDDAKTFKLLQAGDTTGVFQFESSGMRRYMKDLKPTELEDLIALVSLYRPGPMELIPSFIKRKHGQEEITYLHPRLKPILENTYGIGVYQEQMMRIAQELAGYSLPEADTLRKAIGKKIRSLLDQQKEKLTAGMIKNGIDPKVARQIWELFPPFARYGFNKCLTGDTLVLDYDSGKRVSLEDVARGKTSLKRILSMNAHLKLVPSRVKDLHKNGVKPVYCLTTKSGRTITATDNHPFFAPDGWRELSTLQEGERIAVPRILETDAGAAPFAEHELAVLGYLIAEGNLCHPHGAYFYSKDEAEIADYAESLEKFENTVAVVSERKSATSVYSKRKDPKSPSGVVSFLKPLGLRGKKATEKFIPEEVFSAAPRDIAVMIGKMFQGDGCIHLKNSDPQIFYSTSSKRLAHDLQHLLLRFGILSVIHCKQFCYRGTLRPGYTVHVSRWDNIQKFIGAFSCHLIGEKRRRCEDILITHPILNGSVQPWAARGSHDTVPAELFLNAVRAEAALQSRSLASIGRDAGLSQRLFLADSRKTGYLRETAQLIADTLQGESLQDLANSDILWDEIKSIEPIGEAPTYDLEVEETHNFVANDIIVHNSHAACYAMIAYRTAYLKSHYPGEFTAALLNAEARDIERIAFLVSEARQSGIHILAPDVNASFTQFTPEGAEDELKIRFGLLAIKNVGGQIAQAIIDERSARGPFKDFNDFLARVQHKDLNKKSLEAMAKSGVFDSLSVDRNQILANLDEITRVHGVIRRDGGNSQANSLFGDNMPAVTMSVKLMPAPEATMAQKLAWEKELLGFYLSDHPLNGFADRFKTIKARPLAELRTMQNEQLIYRTAGLVSRIKNITTKSGQPMLFAQLEDFSSQTMEVVVFNSTLTRTREVWQESNVVVIEGKISRRDGETKIICERAQVLNK